LQWLYPRKPVKTFQITGKWLDIGSKETLEEANRLFAERYSVKPSSSEIKE
jgi:glucose-1-phosphate thymidylyltransferase